MLSVHPRAQHPKLSHLEVLQNGREPFGMILIGMRDDHPVNLHGAVELLEMASEIRCGASVPAVHHVYPPSPVYLVPDCNRVAALSRVHRQKIDFLVIAHNTSGWSA